MKQMCFALALAAVLAADVLGQQQQKFFRGSVQSVPIYATVVDASGRLVPDLVRENFQVFDNGKPVDITNFDAQVQPISVVTALDLSGSMTLYIDVAKDAAEAFLIRLLPADRARIVEFHDVTRWSPEFTSNRDRLITYLRTELRYGNGTRLWDALYESVGMLKEEANRKVVIVLSDGDDFGSRFAGDGEVMLAAQADNVMVYTVGLRTRYAGGPGGTMIQGRPDRSLKRISEHTGGGYFELSRNTELNSTFSRIADELHRQYLIAVQAQEDGKVHTLDVRVNTPGMKVRARRSYNAVAAK